LQTKRVRSRKKIEDDSLLAQEFERHRTLRIVAVISILAIATLILVGLFAPGLEYSLAPPPAVAVDAQTFLNELEPLVSCKITRNNQIAVIENGENFYEAELDAMRQAGHSINIEAYIFHMGKVTDQVLDVLTDRARAGVTRQRSDRLFGKPLHAQEVFQTIERRRRSRGVVSPFAVAQLVHRQ
jgi:phosphatidylserine/phosphatidylglycerophosphate/cardiolipin synthase-like enzyme